MSLEVGEFFFYARQQESVSVSKVFSFGRHQPMSCCLVGSEDEELIERKLRVNGGSGDDDDDDDEAENQ